VSFVGGEFVVGYKLGCKVGVFVVLYDGELVLYVE